MFEAVILQGWPVPGVEVDVRHPPLACMASQLAGWAIEVPKSGDDPGYYALGSGPARALCRRERIFESITHQEEARAAVLSMESWDLPAKRVADHIAQGCCRTSAEGVYLLVAPTASPAGSVQVAARVVETALYKLYRAGFDLPLRCGSTTRTAVAPTTWAASPRIWCAPRSRGQGEGRASRRVGSCSSACGRGTAGGGETLVVREVPYGPGSRSLRGRAGSAPA